MIWKLVKILFWNSQLFFDALHSKTDAIPSDGPSRYIDTKETNGNIPGKNSDPEIDRTASENLQSCYILNAMMELTISLSFSFKALTAFFLDTLACCMTSSMSLLSKPVSSTSSSSSSSSFFASLVSIALPLPWSWAASAASALASCWAAVACAWELRSSILASPKILEYH